MHLISASTGALQNLLQASGSHPEKSAIVKALVLLASHLLHCCHFLPSLLVQTRKRQLGVSTTCSGVPVSPRRRKGSGDKSPVRTQQTRHRGWGQWRVNTERKHIVGAGQSFLC